MESTQRLQNTKGRVYKTDHWTPEQVEYLQIRAGEQQKRIARWFFRNPDKAIGPTHLHKIFFPGFPEKRGKWEINSTRRAISYLTDTEDQKGNPKPAILEKTDQTCKSLLGGTEHKWRWKQPEETTGPVQMDAFGKTEAQPKSRAYQEGM